MISVRQEIARAWGDGFRKGRDVSEEEIAEPFSSSDTFERMKDVPDLLRFGETWLWLVRSPIKKPGDFTYMPLDKHHIVLSVPHDYELTDERLENIRNSVAQIVIKMSGFDVVQEISPEDPNFN